MAPLHVATLTVQRELPKYEIMLAPRVSTLPYLCTKNDTMAPLHVATLTVQRELPKYEIMLASTKKNETMAPLHVAVLTRATEIRSNFLCVEGVGGEGS